MEFAIKQAEPTIWQCYCHLGAERPLIGESRITFKAARLACKEINNTAGQNVASRKVIK